MRRWRRFSGEFKAKVALYARLLSPRPTSKTPPTDVESLYPPLVVTNSWTDCLSGDSRVRNTR